MSVAVAIRCADGLVLGTDSQGTSSVGNMFMLRSQLEKLHTLGDHIAYAALGAQGLTQRIKRALEDQASALTKERTREEAADIIIRVANPLQKQALDRYVPVPGTGPEEWGAIFCGWGSGGAWMLEVGATAGYEFHNAFTASGSAGAFAHSALVSVRHYDMGTQSLMAAKLVAYRAIESAFEASANSIGPPVQLATVTEQGVHVLGKHELDNLRDIVYLLKDQERALLTSVSANAEEDALADDARGISADEL